MSILTVGWDRAENAASYPQDSGVVFPPAKLTVGWRGMLNSSVLDWDPADLLITPGAGPDPTGPTGPTGTTGTDTPVTPPAGDGGGGGAGTETPPAGPGGPSVPSPACAPGAPDVRVVSRRSLGPFRKEGLRFEVIVPADATVRAVLTWTHREDGERVRRKLTETTTTRMFCGKRVPVRLKPTRRGKRLLEDRSRVKATLELVVTYRGVKEPVRVSKGVVLADSKLK